MTLSVGNSSVQLRLAANAVAPVSLTFVGPVMVRATEAQARPHRLQLEEFALFRLVHEQGVSITTVTASNITQTTATITVTRSNPAAGTLYLVIVPQGVTPTWSRANIATNSGWTATTIAHHDADTDPGTGSTYVFTPDAPSLTAGTPYDLWAVWDNGATTVGPVAGRTFETASIVFPFFLSSPSVTDIKAIEAIPVVQITYE